MNKGSKATLVIPNNLGYGEQGMNPVIPPFSALVFDVEWLILLSQTLTRQNQLPLQCTAGTSTGTGKKIISSFNIYSLPFNTEGFLIS
jgi:hypothetical protein